MTAWGLGGSVSCFTYAKVRHPGLHVWSNLKELLRRSESGFPNWSWSVWLALPSSLSLAFYAWSTSFLPEVVTAVLIEIWPVFYVLYLKFLFREERLFHVTTYRLSLFILVFVGACLVVWSIEPSGVLAGQMGNYQTLAGVVLVGLAVLLSAQTAVFIKWSESAQAWERSQPDRAPAGSGDDSKTGYLMLVRAASQAMSGLIGFCLAGFSLGTVSVGGFLFLFASAAVIDVCGTGFNAVGTFRSANNPGVHSVRFFTPVFSTTMLLLAGYSEGVMAFLFISGLMIVVVTNIAINSSEHDSAAYA